MLSYLERGVRVTLYNFREEIVLIETVTVGCLELFSAVKRRHTTVMGNMGTVTDVVINL